MLFDFDHGRRPAVRHRRPWIDRARHPLQARHRRPQPVADRADDAAVRRQRASGCWSARRAARASSRSTSALAETAVLGAFMAQDLALFVLFFDLMLVPFMFLVRAVGRAGPAVAATLKMIIYTLVGSLLMLAAAVATAVLGAQEADAADLRALRPRADPARRGTQRWLFTGFALAFLIKMPAFPFQGWMPDAYRQMPLPALAVFSGALSKVAAYGFLRVVLPVLPDAAEDFQMLLLLLGLAAILYGSAMAFTQTNLRLVLGYSSVAQLGFITLGIFAFRDEGVQGAILQAVNHGLVVAPIFFIIALVAERAGVGGHPRARRRRVPRPGAGDAVPDRRARDARDPGSANFAGEFLILLGVFNSELVIAIIASTGVAMASVYMLRAYIRTMHNRPGPARRRARLGPRRAMPSCSSRSWRASSRSACTRRRRWRTASRRCAARRPCWPRSSSGCDREHGQGPVHRLGGDLADHRPGHGRLRRAAARPHAQPRGAHRRGPVPDRGDAGDDDRPRDLAVGHQHRRDRGRDGGRQPHARADRAVLRRRHRRRADVRGRPRRRGRRPRRVPRCCCRASSAWSSGRRQEL